MTVSPVEMTTLGRAFLALDGEICRAPRIDEICSWFNVAPASLAPKPSMVCAQQNEARRTDVAVNLASVSTLKDNTGFSPYRSSTSRMFHTRSPSGNIFRQDFYFGLYCTSDRLPWRRFFHFFPCRPPPGGPGRGA